MLSTLYMSDQELDAVYKLFNFCNNPAMFIHLFYRWGKRGTEKFKHAEYYTGQ